jgi:putative aminopeptidase FrvX
MRQESASLLCELSNLDGPSGYETAVSTFVAEQLRDIGAVSYDNLGSLICELQGSAAGPRVMLAGHVDEIGFVVNQVTEQGYLKISPLGGWWDQVLLAQTMRVLTHKGSLIGVVASKPPHLLLEEERNKVVRKSDMHLDIGARDKAQAMTELGVRPGDPIVPVCQCTPMANADMLMGKAWDDRVGVAIVIETLQQLCGTDHPNTIFGVGTVQEEVGLRGAQTAVQAISPDVALVLETAICGDVPGIKDEEAQVKLGGGPTVYVLEGSAIPNLKLRDLAIATCEQLEYECQFSVLERGGTDAGRIHVHACGVPSLVIGVPTRHIHSHAGIIELNDYQQTLALTVELVRKLDAATVASLRPQQ